MKSLGIESGISMQLNIENDTIKIDLSAEHFTKKLAGEIVSELGEHIGKDPAIGIQCAENAVRLLFHAIEINSE
jgi:hypothetical protein